MSEKKGPVRAIFGGIWRGVDGARRFTMNLIFLIFVILFFAACWGGGAPHVPSSGILVLAPSGEIVEQLSGDPLERAVMALESPAIQETLLSDLVRAIDRAREDDRIRLMVIDLDLFLGAGLTKLQDLRRAIDRFKASDKKVLATADLFDRSRYYLAATADEIFMTDTGFFLVQGFGRYDAFFKEGLDRFEIDANVVRVGEFKSAVEPYLRDDMSPEAKESNLDWLGDLWRSYLEDVAALRGLEPAAVEAFFDGYVDRLREAGGDGGAAALQAGLVDQVAGRDALWQRAAEILGQEVEDLEQISHPDYLLALGRLPLLPGEDRLGVIVAAGTIQDGDQPPGSIGGDSTAELIRQAREDDAIKGLVLRVDSGGGSALASEIIRRELELTRAAGKPVVVSMGSVAASGGYWIATSADQIFASPTTLTGSIGIFAFFPTFQKPLEKYLGVRVDGVGTNRFADALRLDRPMSPEMKETLQLWIEQGYREFLQRVAEARHKTVEEVDVMARGRVWSGADALELGLVDQLGGLSEALKAAGEQAGLGADAKVEVLEKPLSFGEQLLVDLLVKTRANMNWIHISRPASRLSPFRDDLRRLLERHGRLLTQLNDPRGIYAHCLCQVD
jgi:protease-4